MTKYIVFDPRAKANECITIADAEGLEEIYAILQCDCVEYAPVTIGGRLYYLILDEMGRLKEDPAPISAIYERDGEWYDFAIGRLLITPPADGKGKDVDCTMEDVENVADNLLTPDDGETVLLHIGFDFKEEKE